MRWNRRGSRYALAAAALAMAAVASMMFAADGEKLTIFLPQSSFTADLFQIGGQEYADLSSVLQGLGPVAGALGDKKYNLRFGNIEAEFEDGSRQAKIGRNPVQLAGPFVIQERRGLVPLRSVAELVPHFTDERVDDRRSSRAR